MKFLSNDVIRLLAVGVLASCTYLACGSDTKSSLNPYLNPGANPGTNPGTNPGAGTNPGTNPGVNPGTNPGVNTACSCGAEQVCDISTNTCIAKPAGSTGDVVGEVVLLNQVREGDPSIIGHLGKGEVEFWDEQPYPADDRDSFATPTGRCYLTYGEELYPNYYKGVSWPSGLGKSAGNLSFRVGGAPGEVVLEELNFDKPNDPSPTGTFYSHDEVPPALRQGAVTYSDMFDPGFAPLGASFTVDAAGGTDIKAATFTGGAMPQPFTITSPPDYKVNQGKIDMAHGMAVTWAPAQPDAEMEIFIVSADAMGMTLLACKVKDDGSVQIPPEALTSFYGETTIQLRRQVTRYQKSTTITGHNLHLYLIGRHARLRLFYANP